MAVSDFFLGSIREFAYSNWPVSMACACTCVDATAKQDIGGGVRKNGEVGLQIKAFIDKYLDIISVVGTGGALRATSGSKICLPNPKSVGQHSPLQDIIYDPIRNHLLHSGELATNMIFTEQA